MKRTNNSTIKQSKKTYKRVKKYSDFVTIILLHDQPVSKKRFPLLTEKRGLCSSSLLECQIQAIHRKFSNYEIILCTGLVSGEINSHIKHKYKKFNIRIIENKDFENCNSCESARLCLQNTNNNKIFIIDIQQ